ncbi:protein PML-like isoform X1 [Terrapene carolina triunguis]|uniref:protein PML-like isoform X1 n=1 Tax=Terrapene triunguis TaxID=2587831 RepID=UPI000CF010BF|nr:protein PML-like isoform X1 [Terrapene carolina triunguis]
MQVMEEEFQFLLCQGCRKEPRNPKLLSCLHTLCTNCLEENKPVGQCPICQAPIPQVSGIPDQDNLLFANLQAKLSTYQKIVSSSDLVCDLCNDQAEFWCSECEEFFCIRCFEAHQWFSKKKSHETRKVRELKAESAKQFLEGARKSRILFCSNPTHNDQNYITSSIYCRGCLKPLCCSCALLDSEHSKLYCNIQTEIERRQEELGSLSEELKRKKAHFEDVYKSLKGKADHIDQVRTENQELIRKRVEHMVKLIREKEQELLEMVDRQHRLRNEDLEGKLKQMEAVLKRMGAGEQLVEKMHLYASDQEVMDMHPFIKESLEELMKLQPLAVGASVQAGDFAECKSKLQALFERVTGERDAAFCAAPAAPVTEVSSAKDWPGEFTQLRTREQHPVPMLTSNIQETHLGIAPPGKRKPGQAEKAIQTPPKVLKLESQPKVLERTPSKCDQGLLDWDLQPGPSTSTPSRNCGGAPAARGAVLSQELGIAHSEPRDQEDSSIVISSSEDTDEDTVLSSVLEGSKDSSSYLQFEWESSAPGSGVVASADFGGSTLVFFDMKVNKDTQMITQLAAANGENSFKAVIQTPESVLSLISQGVSLETGLEHFLCYLRSVPKPVLVVYNFWTSELTVLFKALDSFAKKWDFCTTVCGYLDTLPLIKEKIPTFGLYKMKNLVRMYLQKPLNDSSALASAKALRDLCKLLEIHTDPDPRPVLSHCNLESYTSLQPLLQEKLLTRSAAKTLAMRSMVLCELQES